MMKFFEFIDQKFIDLVKMEFEDKGNKRVPITRLQEIQEIAFNDIKNI